MNRGGHTAIVCEGFHDRAMWQAMLSELNCKRHDLPGQQASRFGFLSLGNHFIEVIPRVRVESKAGSTTRVVTLEGKNNIPRLCSTVLGDSPARIIACYDTDELVPGPEDADGVLQSVHSYFVARGDSCTDLTDRRFRVKDQTEVIAVDWSTSDREGHPGVPNTQTLERVICLALANAYPERAKHVQNWLDSRPQKPAATDSSAKEFPFSYLAGWYSKATSYEAFIKHIWLDGEVKPQLIQILDQAGALAVAREIAS